MVDEVLLSLLGTQAGIMLRHAQVSADATGRHQSIEAVLAVLPLLNDNYVERGIVHFVSKAENICKTLFRVLHCALYIVDAAAGVLWTTSSSLPAPFRRPGVNISA